MDTPLQKALKGMRWDDQGGYPSYMGEGKWSFVSTSIQVTPELLNDLFAQAGIVPDKIIPLGTCSDCANSINGRERGWVRPCVDCKRPKMTNFRRKLEAPE